MRGAVRRFDAGAMMETSQVAIGAVKIGPGQPLALIAGPCVIESRDHTLRLADEIVSVCRNRGVEMIFKASFDKANRTSVDSYRGPGLERGLEILAEIKTEMGVAVTTDIHSPTQAAPVAGVVDCLQIPAFLCRQTDLIVAAARTNRCINVKKGQFMSPEEMRHVVSKAAAQGNRRILLTERGTFFGYHRLVNDMTSIERMRRFAPVVFDATHSCQQPGGAGTQTGGERQYVSLLARSAIAAGADALFLEVHDDPDAAKSDAATQYPLDRLDHLVTQCLRIAAAVRHD